MKVLVKTFEKRSVSLSSSASFSRSSVMSSMVLMMLIAFPLAFCSMIAFAAKNLQTGVSMLPLFHR